MPLPLIALFLAAFAVGTTELIIAGLLPALSADLGVDIPTTGLLISGYALGVAVGGPILAIATNRFPRRQLLLGLMGVFVLGNVLCALSDSYWLLMCARLFIAGSHGLFFGVAMIIATSVVPKERAASAVSLVVAGITLANILGAPAGTAIGNAWGWQASFWVIAVLGVAASVVLAVLVPAAPKAGTAPATDLRREVRAVLRRPVLLSYLMIALAMTGFMALFAYLVPTLTTVTGIPLATVPWLLLVSGIGGFFGNLLGGRLGDWHPMTAIIGVFAAVVVIYIVWYFAIEYVVATWILLFLGGLIGFSFAAPVQARILKGAADAPNLASTLISTAFNIGIAVGPWLGGMALDSGWGYRDLAWITVTFMALALVVAIFTAASERRQAPAPA